MLQCRSYLICFVKKVSPLIVKDIQSHCRRRHRRLENHRRLDNHLLLHLLLLLLLHQTRNPQDMALVLGMGSGQNLQVRGLGALWI